MNRYRFKAKSECLIFRYDKNKEEARQKVIESLLKEGYYFWEVSKGRKIK